MQYKIGCFTDPHLDYKQYGLETRRQDFIDAFDSAINICVEQKVDFLIIPGDFADNKFISLQSLIKIMDSLDKTMGGGISILGITGNHDDTECAWTDFFSEMNSELDIVTLNGSYDAKIFDLKVYGYPYRRENYEKYLMSELNKLSTSSPNEDWWNFFNVLVIHESPESQGGGISDEFFNEASKWFDIILCGHIHTPFNVDNIYNPGALETTKFNLYNEDSGVLIFTVEDEHKRLVGVEKFTTPRRRFVTIEVESNQYGLGDIYTQFWQRRDSLEDSVLKVVVQHRHDVSQANKDNLEKYIKNTIRPLHLAQIKYVDLRKEEESQTGSDVDEVNETENIINSMFAAGFEVSLIYKLIQDEVNITQLEELYEEYAKNTVN